MVPHILFVDDEPNILGGLKRMLRPLHTQWEMEFVNNGAEALALIAGKPVDVIVADMRMPGMDGAELLTRVMQQSPKTVRIILSGQSDKEVIYRVVLPAHQYLSKPCDPEMLQATIERAVTLRELLANEQLQRLVSQVKSLPSLPAIYLNIKAELQSGDPSLHRVGELVEQDMAMSVEMLKLVNSAFFGLRHHIVSPAQAVNLLGMDIVQSLVLMFGIFTQFSSHATEKLGFSLEGLHRHSMGVAAFARELAVRNGLSAWMADDVFIAGLFHDLGKLVLIANQPTKYLEAIAAMQDRHMTIRNAEIAILGASHAEIGANLLGLWGFSDPIVEACLFHHNPHDVKSEVFDTVTAVHVANVLEHQLRATAFGTPWEEFDSAYLRKLNLDTRCDEWRAICTELPT